MSMDDQYRQMINFRQALMDFNLGLRDSMRDLSTRHDYVAPLWQDEMRRHYDAQWNPLNETMKRYLDAEGPSYVEFLHIKAFALERYLYGG